MKRSMVYRLAFEGQPFFVGTSIRGAGDMYRYWTGQGSRTSDVAQQVRLGLGRGQALEVDVLATDLHRAAALEVAQQKRREYGLATEPQQSEEHRRKLSESLSRYWERRKG